MSVSWQVDQPTENCTQSFLWQHTFNSTGRALKTDDTLTSGASDNNLVQNGGTVSKQRDFTWLRSWPAIDERAIPASNDLQVDVTQAVSSTRVVLQPDKPWEVRMDNVYPTAYFEPETNVTHLWYHSAKHLF